MHCRAWLATAVVATSCIGPVAAIQIPSLPPHGPIRIANHIDADSSTIESPISTSLRRRSSTTQSNLARDLDAVSSTCTTLLSSLIPLTSPTDNPSSLFACYNLFSVSTGTNTTFQADLRLYTTPSLPPTGPMSGVSPSDMAILLTYPSSTQYTVQQSTPSQSFESEDDKSNTISQIQHFTLSGILNPKLGVSRLNATQLLSLLIPQISIQALSSTDQNTLLQTALPSTSTAFLTTGEYTQLPRTEVLQAATRDYAQAAIAAAESESSFTLPGQKLAIFPTGLLITASWVGIFLGVCGLGTVGKVRSRGVYRAAIAGRFGVTFA